MSSFTGSPTVDTWAGLRVTDMPGNAVLALRGLVGFWTVDASEAWADDVVLALTRGLVGSRAVDLGKGGLIDEAGPALTIGLVGSRTVGLVKERLLDEAVPAPTRGLVGSRAVDMSEGLLLDDA